MLLNTACSKLLEKVWNKLLPIFNKLVGTTVPDLLQSCSNKTDTVMI